MAAVTTQQKSEMLYEGHETRLMRVEDKIGENTEGLATNTAKVEALTEKVDSGFDNLNRSFSQYADATVNRLDRNTTEISEVQDRQKTTEARVEALHNQHRTRMETLSKTVWLFVGAIIAAFAKGAVDHLVAKH